MIASRVQLAIKALAVARAAEIDENTQVVYLDLLSDLPAETVARACHHLSRQPREAYQSAMPEVGLIRSEVARIIREDKEAERKRRILPAPSDNDPRTWVHCATCSDGGWALFRCDGGTGETGDRDTGLRRYRCARKPEHAAHSYAERCACYDTNPEIEKRRHRQGARETAA